MPLLTKDICLSAGETILNELLDLWKPSAAARTHLLAAALLWTVVGTGLTVAGLRWCLQSNTYPPVLLVFFGVLAGLAKGRFALSRTAVKSAARIARRGDGKCLGGFLSWRTWLFVISMMAFGAILRHSAAPRWVLGVIYTAVGTALLWGCRVFWAARRRMP